MVSVDLSDWQLDIFTCHIFEERKHDMDDAFGHRCFGNARQPNASCWGFFCANRCWSEIVNQASLLLWDIFNQSLWQEIICEGQIWHTDRQNRLSGEQLDELQSGLLPGQRFQKQIEEKTTHLSVSSMFHYAVHWRNRKKKKNSFFWGGDLWLATRDCFKSQQHCRGLQRGQCA